MNAVDEIDKQDLARAKQLLENPGLAARITNMIGSPIERGLEMLPKNWHQGISKLTETALLKATETAAFTMRDSPGQAASNSLHKLSVAASGGLGGLFGLSAIGIELPLSTSIILRSIADIARSEGESISSIDTKMACLEVFALGGRGAGDDAAEAGYFAVRTALAKSVSDATAYILKSGVSESASPVLIKLVARVANSFGVQVTQKAAAQAIPAIGAAGGALINTIFIDHYQCVARGHFIVRRLERKYGKELIQNLYNSLPSGSDPSAPQPDEDVPSL